MSNADTRGFRLTGWHVLAIFVLFFGVVLLFAIQHAVSHRVNWIGRREFERLPATQTQMLPYIRVGGTFILSIVGGTVVSQLGSPSAAIAALAIVKLAVDAVSHVYVHRTLAPREPLLAQ